MGRKITCQSLMIGVLVTLLQACPLSHGAEHDPLSITARLPIKLIHIRDARASFARTFDTELTADPLWSGKGASENFLFYTPQDILQVRRAGSDYGKTAVLIVPGILGECFDDQALPFTDGRVRSRQTAYIDAYRGLSAALATHSVEAIPVMGRAGSEENARIIKKAILDKASDPGISSIIVVAYSKGTPDALEAISHLHRTGELSSKLHALVSVAGVVMGTPIADSLEHLYRIVNRIIGPNACGASDGKDIASLRTDVRSQWLAQSPLPTAVKMYSVVAAATKDTVGLGLRGTYLLLSASDRQNDGQMMISDAILPSSVLLAVAKSDHWDFVLPLSSHPDRKIRRLTSGHDFPRQALFRALVRYVIEDIPTR